MAEVKTNGFVVAVVLIILIVFMTNTGGGGKSTISQEEVKLLRERVAQLETKLGATLVNSGRARSMSTLTSSSGAVMQRPAAAAARPESGPRSGRGPPAGAACSRASRR